MLLLWPEHATWADVYKCQVDGQKAQYQSAPCLSGKSAVLKVAASPAPRPQAPHAEAVPTAQDVLDSQKAQERSRQFPLENHLSLNLPNIRLRAALQVIADFAGYALVVDPAIVDEGSFQYKNMPASAILADLARRYGLRIQTDNRTVAVSRR
ncbi:MAG: hypothetical protein WAQ08_18715 [Aquabacterium sp.]|uniref:hypothetical protein n=1 Tax=Aquabacterium sp. TaxID=1872578 RepID=UPI003BAF20E9